MPDISDSLPDKQPNLDVRHISQSLDNQQSQPLYLTDNYLSEGGGINDSCKQVVNITQGEDNTIDVEPEPIKVGDKVLVSHAQANDQGDRVREVGEGWLMVDWIPVKFPLDQVVRI
jgi:hypothetical protein